MQNVPDSAVSQPPACTCNKISRGSPNDVAGRNDRTRSQDAPQTVKNISSSLVMKAASAAAAADVRACVRVYNIIFYCAQYFVSLARPHINIYCRGIGTLSHSCRRHWRISTGTVVVVLPNGSDTRALYTLCMVIARHYVRRKSDSSTYIILYIYIFQ